jgi:hypothetical protein
VLLLILSLQNCDWFSTREAEEPGGSSNIWIPPANPAEVLENIDLAFQLHDGILYMKSFAQPGYSDSIFVFHPDVTSPNFDSSIFTDWGYSREQAFIFTLFSPDFLPQDSLISFQFIPEIEPPGEYLPLYREKYNIVVHHTQANLSTEFSGRAEIQFDRNHNGDWVIINWTDEKLEDKPTFTELKSAISN